MKKARTVLREGELADLESMVKIDETLFPPEISYDPETFLFYLLHPSSDVILAEINGEVAGFAIVTLSEPGDCQLVTIDVAKKMQRLGIGASLLKAAHQRAGSRGAKSVSLQVDTNSTDAIRFYERAGYEKKGPLPNYYRNLSDAWEMVIKL